MTSKSPGELVTLTTPASINADGKSHEVDRLVTNGALVIAGELPTADDIVVAVANKLNLTYLDDVTEAEVLARYASAESGAEMMAPLKKLTMPKQNLGTTFRLERILGGRNSDFQPDDDGGSGVGIYLIVEAVDPDGEVIALGVGTNDAMVKVLRLHELGALPWSVAFEQADKATPRGFKPINMVDRQLADPFPAQ